MSQDAIKGGIVCEPRHIGDYHKWMERNVQSYNEGSAKTITRRMQKAFPGLRRFSGIYSGPGGVIQEHWWLEWCGLIIDPYHGDFEYPGYGYDGVEVKP